MNQLTMDVRRAQEVLAALQAQEDQSLVAQAAGKQAQMWTSLTNLHMQGILGAPDWSTCEAKLWDLGEQLRILMKARRWRGAGPLLDLAAEILIRREFGKGRQTFALLLGEFGGEAYGSALASALDDPEVAGHAVKALLQAKMMDYADKVQNVAAKSDGWVRRAAQRYLKRAAAV